MNFYRNIIFIYFFLIFNSQVAFSASNEVEKILAGEEDELPLNNPFDGTKGSNNASNLSSDNSNNIDELANPMSLFNFKLVGVIAGKKHSYISLVNLDGNSVILQLEEELYDGLKLVDLKLNEAIFKKKDNTFVSINFKNEIKEVNE